MQVDKSKCIVSKQQTDEQCMQKTIRGGRLQLLIDKHARKQTWRHVGRQIQIKNTPKTCLVGKRQRSVQADINADNRHGAEELLYTGR